MASTPTCSSIQGNRPRVLSLKRDSIAFRKEEWRLSTLSKGALRRQTKTNQRRFRWYGMETVLRWGRAAIHLSMGKLYLLRCTANLLCIAGLLGPREAKAGATPFGRFDGDDAGLTFDNFLDNR